MQLRAKRPSKWKYDTSSGYTFGVNIPGTPITATRAEGQLVLTSPEGREVRFDYSLNGGAVSKTFKIADTGKFSFAGSTEAMLSRGDILIGEGFGGGELSAADFEGFCIAQEVSAGFGWAYGAAIWALGIPLTKLPLTILTETGLFGAIPDMKGGSEWLDVVGGALGGWLAKKAIGVGRMAPKAMLRTRAKTGGWQGGIGGGSAVGLVAKPGTLQQLLRFSDTPNIVPILEVPPSLEELRIRSKSSEQIEVIIPGDILFKFDDDQFKSDSRKIPASTNAEIAATLNALDIIGDVIEEKVPRKIAVWGHTDSIEHKPGYNQGLSERRANTMRQWIITNGLMDPAKVYAYGAAAREPVASNATAEGRQQNRRVVLYLFFG